MSSNYYFLSRRSFLTLQASWSILINWTDLCLCRPSLWNSPRTESTNKMCFPKNAVWFICLVRQHEMALLAEVILFVLCVAVFWKPASRWEGTAVTHVKSYSCCQMITRRTTQVSSDMLWCCAHSVNTIYSEDEICFHWDSL